MKAVAETQEAQHLRCVQARCAAAVLQALQNMLAMTRVLEKLSAVIAPRWLLVCCHAYKLLFGGFMSDIFCNRQDASAHGLLGSEESRWSCWQRMVHLVCNWSGN